MPNIYEAVRTHIPKRSAFNLSYFKQFTCDMGQIIPIMCDEVVPGDIFKIGAEAVVRLQPQVAPVLHEVNVVAHYYFVADRLLWTDWEKFITGDVTGTDTSTLPRWTPAGTSVTNDDGTSLNDNASGSLWDYMGFPVGVIPTGATPVDFPRRAYNKVFNEYYRDETQQTPIAETSSIVKNCGWEKDFYTSALPWQQRGTAPALPISGTSAATWTSSEFSSTAGNFALQGSSGGPSAAYEKIYNISVGAGLTNVQNMFNKNTVNLGTATTFNVADLRLAFQIQKWQERNARGGARYTEFIRNHFGPVEPKDERLDRAEYIGGCKFPIIVSEVLQTSRSEAGQTPQGTMAGHGLASGSQFCGSYRVQEHGIILGVMMIKPKPAYFQGVDRQWLRMTRYDYYSPEFANLSEQAVIRAELYANAVSGDNTTIFGYQGRHNEYRSKKNMCHAGMRPVAGQIGLNWNLVRAFASAPALNETFIRCVPRKDYLAVTSQPACIVHWANKIKAIRPMPIEPNPGLIDHN